MFVVDISVEFSKKYPVTIFKNAKDLRILYFFTFKLYPSIIKEVRQLHCRHSIPMLLETLCTTRNALN